MVYRGKPSSACEECRKRRTRCNRAVPACGQCIKARRTCPGYRNTTDLMFFDQSHQVAKKNKWHQPPSAGPSALPQGPPAVQPVVPRYSAPVQLNDVVLYQPLISPDDLGINFFMRQYVGASPKSSQFGFLPNYYFTEGFGYAELEQSLKAVGLAGYAKDNRRPELLPRATKSYISAVRDINKALSHPTSAVREATLISVLLLAMFEVMTLPRASGLENLTKHLRGAVTIACMCLKQEKVTEITQKLLVTVVQSAVMDSWIQNVPLPPELLALRKGMRSRSDAESNRPEFLDLIVELVEFRTAVDRGDSIRPADVISEALRIDISLRHFGEEMPKHILFEKVLDPTESKELVYDGYYHVYPVNTMAHMWNNIRLSRLRLHQVVLGHCDRIQTQSPNSVDANRTSSPTDSSRSSKTPELPSQRGHSEAIVVDLAREICASVPQLADYMSQLPSFAERKRREKERNSPFMHNPGAFKKTNLPRSPVGEMPRPIMAIADPRPASLYHIFFQLQTLSTISFLPEAMKHWIQGRLRWIEQTADADDLEMLREMLRKKKSV